jgi:GTPase
LSVVPFLLYIARMDEQTAPARETGGVKVETRAGLVALVGRPNVGKSTLMNALLGEKLSIVTPREQTTRERVLGILTEDGVQAVFVDTPGLLEPRYLLQESMLGEALAAVTNADVVLLLVDPTRSDDPVAGAHVLDRLRSQRDGLQVAINKSDAATAAQLASSVEWSRRTLGVDPLVISAVAGTGLVELRRRVESMLPVSPFLYPEEDLAVQSVRFFVEELIRETIFEEYAQEIPYSTVVRVEEYRETDEPVYIRAQVYVERESQKGILIGKGGEAIKRLGSISREKIEAFTGQRVYLDLWVKPLAGWRKKASSLRRLGYRITNED